MIWSRTVGGVGVTNRIRGGPPLKTGLPSAIRAPLCIVPRILAALYSAGRPGAAKNRGHPAGSRDQSHSQCLQGQARLGRPLERAGNASTSAQYEQCLRCKPGGPNDYVFIHISREAISIGTLCSDYGREDLVGDARYSTGPARVAHKRRNHAIGSAWCRDHTKSEIMEVSIARGRRLGRYSTCMTYNDPHLRKRGIFVSVEHPMRGAITSLGERSRCQSPTCR